MNMSPFFEDNYQKIKFSSNNFRQNEVKFVCCTVLSRSYIFSFIRKVRVKITHIFEFYSILIVQAEFFMLKIFIY